MNIYIHTYICNTSIDNKLDIYLCLLYRETRAIINIKKRKIPI